MSCFVVGWGGLLFGWFCLFGLVFPSVSFNLLQDSRGKMGSLFIDNSLVFYVSHLDMPSQAFYL